MKEYALFYGSVYYPGGGMTDLEGWYDSIEECKDRLKFLLIESYGPPPWLNKWFHIVRWQAGNVIQETLRDGVITEEELS